MAEVVGSNATLSTIINLVNYGIVSSLFMIIVGQIQQQCLWINRIQRSFDDMFDIPRIYISAYSYAVYLIVTNWSEQLLHKYVL